MSSSVIVRAWFPLVISMTAACSGGAPDRAAGPPVVQIPQVAPTPAGSATGEARTTRDDPTGALVALVCARREKPCELVKEHQAGADAKGRAVSAALFLVGYPETDEEKDGASGAGQGEPGKRRKTGAPPKDAGLTLEADGARFDPYSHMACFAYEYWRVVREGEGLVEADRIAEICNDGHGASGVGEDTVKVGPNWIEIGTSGGSAWRWGGTVKYALSPFVRLAESETGYWNVSSNREDTRIDWETLSGLTTWTAQMCAEDGTPIDGEAGALPELSYAWIPAVGLDPAFVADGWKTTRLDRCAVTIDGAGAGGTTVTGAASSAQDARMKLVAAPTGELFVEVTDDAIVGPTARAASDDHLEVWAAPALPAWDAMCVHPTSTTGVVAWDVRVADGKVTAGFGKPLAKDLAVERAADPSGAVRLKLRLPKGLGAVTIAYADSDGGGKIERRIATSDLTNGRVATLGKVAGAADHVRCTAQNGGLVPELLPVKLPVP